MRCNPNILCRYDAVIFDLHGTLIPWCKDGFRAMLLEMAHTIGVDGDDFKRAMDGTVHESMIGQFSSMIVQVDHICRVLDVHADADSIEQAAQLWHDFHWQGYEKPYAGAFTVLQQLREIGVKIGLITNCGIEAPELWSRSLFSSLVDTAIFSTNERLVKPDPQIYSTASERLGVLPEKCLYVDDSVIFLAGAKAIGMSMLLIRHPGNMLGLRGIDEWNGLKATSLSEVISYVTLITS